MNRVVFPFGVSVSPASHEGRLRSVLDALPAAVYATDANGYITFYNRPAVELAGREPVLGVDRWCVSLRLYCADGTPLPHDQCPMATAIKENREIRGAEVIAERPDGTRVPLTVNPTPLRDADGRLIGAVNMLVDISRRKASEERQRTLMSELNHRVKNNMQMLQSLLGAAERETDNVEARAVLADAVRRVGAMAAAQHAMYGAGPAKFEARPFLEALCRNANQAFGRQADIAIESATGELPNDAAVPLALILNELLTNAVQYARRDDQRVSIAVALTNHDGPWRLAVEDDGPGFVLPPITRRARGLGLVIGLARQLGGTFDVTTGRGARCVVQFGGGHGVQP